MKAIVLLIIISANTIATSDDITTTQPTFSGSGPAEDEVETPMYDRVTSERDSLGNQVEATPSINLIPNADLIEDYSDAEPVEINSKVVDDFLLEEEQTSGDGSDEISEVGGCSMYFKLPSSLQCERNQVEDEHFRKLYSEVLAAKYDVERIRLNIEGTRKEMIDQQALYPSPQAIKESINTVEHLKQESQNSNERVNQLYLQLIHEIVNKRDNQLDYEKLKGKILEQQVVYHQLQENLTVMSRYTKQLEDTTIHQAAKLEALETDQGLMRKKVQLLEQLCAVQKDKELERSSVSEIVETSTKRYAGTHGSSKIRNSRVIAKGNFKNCNDVQRYGHDESGIYRLRVTGLRRSVKVWCDLDLDPSGWLVIQRRNGMKIDFNRGWSMYKKGFGRLHDDFWLGLETIHMITNTSRIGYKLHIRLEDWEDNIRIAEYQSFKVKNEASGYQLHIAHYSGNAGDSMSRNNYQRFTTKDADSDRFSGNCALNRKGGWWFSACGDSNLNGRYYNQPEYISETLDGIFWNSWHGNHYSLRRVTMMIRPND